MSGMDRQANNPPYNRHNSREYSPLCCVGPRGARAWAAWLGSVEERLWMGVGRGGG